ncbi:hypothetical protein [Marinifilum sp. D714]|uniref:hypothetical protein n=1 Tax=Marinifilum sp. D714 TaxID=2937523 RepID=UPI0027C8E18A|nr:hypothetical protein [Marinifilum sp. D714]MDQ2178936.1 hypothetical protein [Marinifilum sp. D714]
MSQLINEIKSRGENCLEAEVFEDKIQFKNTNISFPLTEEWEVLHDNEVISNLNNYIFPSDFSKESNTTPEKLISTIPKPIITIRDTSYDFPMSISFCAFQGQSLKNGHNLKPRSIVKYEIMWSSWIFEKINKNGFGRNTVKQFKINEYFAACGGTVINFNNSKFKNIELALSILAVEIDDLVIILYGLSYFTDYEKMIGSMKKIKMVRPN